MELRHLRYFIAVAENLSFRRAADRLHLTRPALSKQIKELENELGLRLLDRNTARVTLTPAGEVYLQSVREVLAQVERAAELAREANVGRRGHLVIGEPGVLGLTFLTPVLARFREQFPHVDITLAEMPATEHVLAVESGAIQVGFATNRHVVDRPALETLSILRLRVGLAVGRDHPVARRRHISLDQVADQTFICIGGDQPSEHAQYVREHLAKAGFTQPRVRRVSGIRSLMTMIASGHGVSLLPDALAEQTQGEVIIVPLEGSVDSAGFELLAVWRRHEESLLLKNFVRALRRFAPSPSRLGGPGEPLRRTLGRPAERH